MKRKEKGYLYDLIPWDCGEVGLVWRTDGGHSRICRILLPHEACSTTERVMEDFPDALLRVRQPDEFGLRLRTLLSGNPVVFDSEMLDFGMINGFAQRVLRLCARIPRGRVTTYGKLAAMAGVPGGARAVGNVMAGNPFPLAIPCHRVVRSDGSLGGFGGGPVMKRRLLELEAIRLDKSDRVFPEHIL